MIKVGNTYTFDYPKVFVTLPEYTAHTGAKVIVLRQCTEQEAEQDEEHGFEKMYKVRAEDGWEGDAFESELKPVEG